jgi:twitching motility protein PilT
MAQVDRLMQTMLTRGATQLVLATGSEPSIFVAGRSQAIVQRVLAAAQVRFLLSEILNDAATQMLETQGFLDFGYTPAGLSRISVSVRSWHGDTVATFRPDPKESVFPVSLTSPHAVAAMQASVAGLPQAPSMRPGAAQTGDLSIDAPPVQIPPFDALLRLLVQQRASDLHLSAGQAPMMRRDGSMQRVPGMRPLSAPEVLAFTAHAIPERSKTQFETDNDTDFAYEIVGLSRFRVNLFRDRLGPGIVVRVVPNEILSADALALPQSIRNFGSLSKGLVLVTGPTGSGKSTTLAALVDLINNEREDHIITLEDPIEFVHMSKKCLVNQREVGNHTTAFKRALRAALREDPDVVLVGEMRDLETVEIAIETAETGHLVFGTLHTTTAASTIDRVIDQFPGDRQAQIRVMLAESLRGVVAQTLCKKIGGGRVAALEILIVTPAISNLIREGKTYQIQSIMQTSRKLGMSTLNDALLALVVNGQVAPREAYLRAVDKNGLLKAFQAANVQLEAEPVASRAGSELGMAVQHMDGQAEPGRPQERELPKRTRA